MPRVVLVSDKTHTIWMPSTLLSLALSATLWSADTIPQPPKLILPRSEMVVHASMVISVLFPVEPKAGSAKLVFTNVTSGTTSTLIFDSDGLPVNSPLTLEISPRFPKSDWLARGDVIPDGVYDVTLSYQTQRGVLLTARATKVTVQFHPQ